MPYKRHDPASTEEMERDRYENHYTICQFLRDIYHMTDDEEIRMKCRIGVTMTKAMNQRLQDYKHAEEARQRVLADGGMHEDAALVAEEFLSKTRRR
jgi:hypothetical protein